MISQIIKSLPLSSPDAIQKATFLYNSDKRENKVALHIGVMKDENGQDVILESVEKARDIVRERRKNKNTYITAKETAPFQEGVKNFLFGENKDFHERTAIVDSYGGTNGLFLLEMFCAKYFGDRTYILAEDGWPNHNNQIKFAIAKELKTYRIADANLAYIHAPYEELINSLGQNQVITIEQNGPMNSLGITLSKQDWDKRLELIQRTEGIIIFDTPYAGLGESLENDLYPIRKAIEMGIFVLISHSESKIKSAYDQRVGAALIVGRNKPEKEKIQGALNKIERAVQSFTVKTHLIFAELYGNPELLKLWEKEFEEKILKRTNHCRELAVKYIDHEQTKTILKKGKGLFAAFPMPHLKADKLWQEHGIMLVKPDQKSVTFDNQEIIRLNLTGLQNDEKAEKTLKTINEILKK